MMGSLREELFEKLLTKTKELGRKVDSSEMRQDPNMPDPNQYAYYFGSFANAAEEAFRKIQYGGGRLKLIKKEVADVSNFKNRQIDPERQKEILNEFVDMYIKNDGAMPTDRMVKKNSYLSGDEVAVLRANGVLNERIIRKMAAEKTGREFLSSEERRKQTAQVRPVAKKPVIEESEVEEKQPEVNMPNLLPAMGGGVLVSLAMNKFCKKPVKNLDISQL